MLQPVAITTHPSTQLLKKELSFTRRKRNCVHIHKLASLQHQKSGYKMYKVEFPEVGFFVCIHQVLLFLPIPIRFLKPKFTSYKERFFSPLFWKGFQIMLPSAAGQLLIKLCSPNRHLFGATPVRNCLLPLEKKRQIK